MLFTLENAIAIIRFPLLPSFGIAIKLLLLFSNNPEIGAHKENFSSNPFTRRGFGEVNYDLVLRVVK